ncbi:bombesin receptor-activated protein C6orf89 homolog isoform X2 [Monodelphis domestica]|nr:bombesin receptor-activated protein C6orf89 homolog isoform X2 [Monodelphis domestica]
MLKPEIILTMDFILEDMDLAANELSIYDKLSETIDLVRQTGHQCGMSEKAIEKFIKQLLEKNEPQRGPPRHPLLMVAYKVLITLGLTLLTAYFVIQPYSPLPPEPVLSGAHTWRSLIHHIRLLSLPIAKKYMLENKEFVPLSNYEPQNDDAYPDCDDWWKTDCNPNNSTIPANCTGCALITGLQVIQTMSQLPPKFEKLQPLLIKTGQSLSSKDLQLFQCQYPELTEGISEGLFARWWNCFPHQRFPFSFPWSRPLNRSNILHQLFPVFDTLPFPKDVSLKSCFVAHQPPVLGSKMRAVHDLFVIGSGEGIMYLTPPTECRKHCNTVVMQLEPGDVGYASVDHWKISVGPRGTEPLVICDGTTNSEM